MPKYIENEEPNVTFFNKKSNKEFNFNSLNVSKINHEHEKTINCIILGGSINITKKEDSNNAILKFSIELENGKSYDILTDEVEFDSWEEVLSYFLN